MQTRLLILKGENEEEILKNYEKKINIVCPYNGFFFGLFCKFFLYIAASIITIIIPSLNICITVHT
jgi:hypothetical protein